MDDFLARLLVLGNNDNGGLAQGVAGIPAGRLLGTASPSGGHVPRLSIWFASTVWRERCGHFRPDNPTSSAIA